MLCGNHPTDLFGMVSLDEYAWTEASVQTEVQASRTVQEFTDTLAPSSMSVGDGNPMFVSSPVHENPSPPPPKEDARLFSINMLDAEDRLVDMLDADSILAPSRTISMTDTPLVCLFVLRTHHVQAYAFLLTRAPPAG